MEKQLELRKCFVLEEVEIDFKDLKKGDLFRQGKTKEDTGHDDDSYWVSCNDAFPEKPEGNSGVRAHKISFVKDEFSSINIRLRTK